MCERIDIKQSVYSVSEHVDSPSAYLTFKMIQSSVCLYNYLWNRFSKAK